MTREAWASSFSLLVLEVLPMYLQVLHVLYDILMYTLHVYKPQVWPVASRILFLDIQVVILSLGEFSLFAHANLYHPTTRVCLYFSTILVAHLHVYTRTMLCRRGLSKQLTFTQKVWGLNHRPQWWEAHVLHCATTAPLRPL